ncbi:NADPH-dependent FMN reductase [Haloechinothrix sp. LS1_15]|uniref:NADPH-dependent FMN reductase n=1 Tax=Haloechinothrix sp. LS1_15 TaxID=2652248 RepID=UPI002945190F|nr:NADPH-dependent FMN reductase [Haloechinothrix sp. LS1_15]MDV6011758.1 NADPH-dependent FMN reductase [Haloechinothrix sp. LS1_15]
MTSILVLTGSPSAASRTAALLGHLADRWRSDGHDVHSIAVRNLPAEALLSADATHPEITTVTEAIAAADGIVVASPVYKAAYSGVLKVLLDLLPQYAFAGKTVLPLATGGTSAHVLAIDYAMRPVLNSLGAHHIVQGYFVLDRLITVTADGVALDEHAERELTAIVDEFSMVIHRDDRLITAS